MKLSRYRPETPRHLLPDNFFRQFGIARARFQKRWRILQKAFWAEPGRTPNYILRNLLPSPPYALQYILAHIARHRMKPPAGPVSVEHLLGMLARPEGFSETCRQGKLRAKTKFTPQQIENLRASHINNPRVQSANRGRKQTRTAIETRLASRALNRMKKFGCIQLI